MSTRMPWGAFDHAFACKDDAAEKAMFLDRSMATNVNKMESNRNITKQGAYAKLVEAD